MGTAWLQDAFTQAELTLSAVKLASEFLKPGGTFVTKVRLVYNHNGISITFWLHPDFVTGFQVKRLPVIAHCV